MSAAILLLLLCLRPRSTAALLANEVVPRWGHSAVYMPRTGTSSARMYVLGGRTDPLAEFSYTSAPITNQVLSLDLEQDFATETVSWDELAAQDPSTAWHVSGAFKSQTDGHYLFKFGGDAGFDVEDFAGTDSVWTHSVEASSSTPLAAASDQPPRLWYGSAAGSPDGRYVYILGGAQGDGSFQGSQGASAVSIDSSSGSPTVVFDPLPPLPVELSHHTSLTLPNGTIVVLGGVMSTQQELSPLTTAYVLLEPGVTASWSTVSLAGLLEGRLPPARRSHSLVLVSPDKALLYGGATVASALAQVTSDDQVLSDLWELDLISGSWRLVETNVNDLSSPGKRYEHSSVAVDGRMIVFGGE